MSDKDFDLLLAQKNVKDDDIKSFIDYDEQLIVFRSRLMPDHCRELILHELLHAMLIDSTSIQDEYTEQFISKLAPRLVGALNAIQIVFKEVV